jgi:hypothetical protein
MDQLGKQLHGPEIGEEAEFLAQPPQGRAGLHGVRVAVVLRGPDRAEQHRVAGEHDVQGRPRQRIPRGLEPGAADRRLREGEARAVGVEGAQHLQGLRHDLRTDAVTRQDRDLHALQAFSFEYRDGDRDDAAPSRNAT